MKRLLLPLLLFALTCSLAAEPARVLFLGEEHTRVSDHEGQLSVLRGLEGEKIVVAAEMFTVRATRFLESWNTGSGKIPEELWQEEWGHPYDLYRNIFEWTRGRAVLASLRPGPELTSRVKQQGAASVLPHIGEMLVGPESYRESLRKTFAEHLPTDVPITEEMMNRYFLIQCFWDEYMAWRISQLADQYPDHRIAVLVGYGHLHPEYGIPARLKRRRPELKSVNVAFAEDRRGQCDLLILKGDSL